MPETTTIQVSIDVWQRLNSRKKPGDSFNDIIKRLLDETQDSE